MKGSLTLLRNIMHLASVSIFGLIMVLGPQMAHATVLDPSDPTLDGAVDLEDTVVDIGDYRQVLGGKFPPPGDAINGDNASGGTFRFMDDAGTVVPPGAFIDMFWTKDDFFSNQQGVAFTLRHMGTAVWDNNGIEDGSYATINKVCVGGTNFRDTCSVDGDCPGSTCSSASFYEEAFGGLIQPNCCTSPRSDNGQVGVGRNHALSLSNSILDFMYASRVELLAPTTIDEIIGYFAPIPLSAFAFDPDNPLAIYRMNIWSASTADPLLPTFTGDFVGDVLSTDTTPGTFTRSDTGVRRNFPSTTTTVIDDPIFRLTWIPDDPIPLPAGVYYFNHDVRVRVFKGNDHYACYEAEEEDEDFVKRVVTLEDQFESKLTKVKKPKRLCNPASKNLEGFIDPTAHLTCYDIKDEPGQQKFAKRNVVMNDQFGELTLTVKKAKRLCVPSEKNGENSDLNINHFKCYGAKEAKGTPKFEKEVVSLLDQFGDENALVKKPKELCLPVDKNGSHGRVDSTAFGLPLTADPDSHLTCYNIKRETEPEEDVTTVDQFGELALKIEDAKLLCVPSTKGEVTILDDDED